MRPPSWDWSTRSCPREQLEHAAGELAQRLAGGPTKAIGMAKWLLNRSLESDRRTAFDEEAWAQELIVGTADAGEGLRAFAERRAPEVQGVLDRAWVAHRHSRGWRSGFLRSGAPK